MNNDKSGMIWVILLSYKVLEETLTVAIVVASKQNSRRSFHWRLSQNHKLTWLQLPHLLLWKVLWLQKLRADSGISLPKGSKALFSTE